MQAGTRPGRDGTATERGGLHLCCPAAGFCRLAAGSGALVHPDTFAFFGTAGARLRAELAQLRGKGAAPGQQRNACLAQVSAVGANPAIMEG
ncbi:MAG: hypothetical protein NVSMB43_16850 [Pseudarthrobacter sp.]